MSDKPKEQFRGWSIPVEIVHLFQEGQINANETLLLATIDSLVSEARGCWAGNEYLANKMNMTKDSISRMTTKLKRLGLIKQVAFNGRIRQLETAWSRMQTTEKSVCRLRKNLEADPAKIRTRNRDTSRVSKKRNSLSTPEGADGACEDSDSPGSKPTTQPPRKKRRAAPSPFHHKCAAKLRAAVSFHIKVNRKVSLPEWAKQFRIMETRDQVPRADIKRAIQWYAANIGGEYVPRAFSAKAFREKYCNGQIPDAMLRGERQNGMHRDEQGSVRIVKPDGESEVLVDRVEQGGYSLQDQLFVRIRSFMEEAGTYNRGGPNQQEDVDAALAAMGLEPGAVKSWQT